ncbi:hypothetical protein LTS08_005560 [Lithohypha guttulata]|nr:hypothetical protein LTS08_005560 [Lithohypha guttulata]
MSKASASDYALPNIELGQEINVSVLPDHLQELYFASNTSEDLKEKASSIQIIPLDKLEEESSAIRIFQLLLHREWLTARLVQHGKCHPPLILQRALVYEALDYDDLAAFDAFVVYTLCQKAISDEFVTDLEAHNLDGSPWVVCSDDDQEMDTVQQLRVRSLTVLIRCLYRLGAVKDARSLHTELVQEQRLSESLSSIPVEQQKYDLGQCKTSIRNDQAVGVDKQEPESVDSSRFGKSRREIYPWSRHEPDRNSSESIHEINESLSRVSGDLEAKITALPAFDTFGAETEELSYQLGLFAKTDLQPGTQVLAEKSILTAIRPLEDAICDACGQELEGIPFEDIRQCVGSDCDITFCSEDCRARAVSEYHQPAIDDDEEDQSDEDATSCSEDESTTNRDLKSRDSIDEDQTPDSIEGDFKGAPICGNHDLSTIGRPTNTDTPEWDLYFLLLTRTIAMSITQQRHPLQLKEIKYLWGDFNPCSLLSICHDNSYEPPPRTLPFSFLHNLQYVLDYFSTLSLSCANATPYSAHWLQNFDFWILQILFSKFRGVANATQSTFDGKPEIASVHPLWCLANHSCAPNVTWTPKGVREFFVRTAEEREWQPESASQEAWTGIKAGEEIFSHYTDIELPVQDRRDRLREVLGGICRCERCIAESGLRPGQSP